MGTAQSASDPRVSMEPQMFCCLPWCGKSFAGPNKRYKVDGKILEYPEGIDFHHVDGHHKGPGIYICSGCHTSHHSEGGHRITTDWIDDKWWAALDGGAMRPCRVYDEVRDTIPVETDEVLGDLASDIRELKCSADQVDYFLSRELAEAERKLHGDRKRLAEWCVDNLDISPRSVDSYLSKRISYASLPESCSTLGITNGYKVWQLSQKYPLDEVLSDYQTMSRSHFNETYGLTKHRAKCECPVCGATHSTKEAE